MTSAAKSMPPSGGASPSHSSRLGRWSARIVIAAVIAGFMVVGYGPGGYGERLLARQGPAVLPADVDALACNSAALRAQLMDVANDRELLAKMAVALTRNRDDAARVLTTYGADSMFRDVLRQYGEAVVPVVAYFMKHDIATLRLQYGWQRVRAAWERIRCKFFGCRTEPGEAAVYSDQTRGLHAIERLQRHGYNFLGQFDVDSKGVAHWNQTERTLESVEEFLLGGFRDLEKKHHTGQPIGALDIALAGADAMVLLGGAKLLKMLSWAKGAPKIPDVAVAIKRSDKQVKRVLKKDRLAEWVGVSKAGPKTQTAYLMARHPSLLAGLFADLATWLGAGTRLAAAVGWWIVTMALSLIVLPLLQLVLSLLIPAFRALRWLVRWLRGGAVRPKNPSRSLAAQRSAQPPTQDAREKWGSSGAGVDKPPSGTRPLPA